MTLHIDEYERKQQEKIAEEILKYPLKVFFNFQKTFPCKGLLSMDIFIKIPRVEHIYSIGNEYPIEHHTTYVKDVIKYEYDGSQKFWRDWNRYKNLKAFL